MNLIKIVIYTTSTGKEPFSEWQEQLDSATRGIVRTRLDRVSIGNFGDSTPIKGGNGIWELRINHGPGYRIYFGKQGTKVVILLVGGDKSSQTKDIAKAKRYWLTSKELL